jgi:hypothetical protein
MNKKIHRTYEALVQARKMADEELNGFAEAVAKVRKKTIKNSRR